VRRYPDWLAGVIGFAFLCVLELDMRTIRNGPIAAISFLLALAFSITYRVKQVARFIDKD